MSVAVGRTAPRRSGGSDRPTGGALLRAEALRLRSRRMVRVLLAVGLLGLLAGIIISSTQFARPSAAGLAGATQRRAQLAADSARAREQCLAAVGRPQGPPSAADCGPAIRPQDIGRVEDFVDKRPFTLAKQGRGGVLGVSLVAAGLAFLLGATSVGAEWSSRSIVAQLFWEPRRRRVMASKVAVLVALTAVFAVLAEGTWLLAARVLAATRGSSAVRPGLWHLLFAAAGRGVLLVVLLGLLGYGIANLLRNTAAAAVVGFLYLAVVENALRILKPSSQAWLATDNAAALLSPGGLRLILNESFVDNHGVYNGSGRPLVLSNLHGGLVLGGATAALVLLSVVLFARRDLT